MTATIDPVTDLLDRLRGSDIVVRAVDGKLLADAPEGAVTTELVADLRELKDALIECACGICGSVQLATYDSDGRPRCKEHDGTRPCGVCGSDSAPIGLTLCVGCSVDLIAERATQREAA
jgi:hypothetical protein